MNVRREEIAEIRHRIVGGASRRVRGKAFEAGTLDDVTEAAGPARGSFCGHFGSSGEYLARFSQRPASTIRPVRSASTVHGR